MDRSALIAAGFALLAVLALGIGAATIDSAVTADGDGFGAGGDGVFGETDAGEPDAEVDAEGGAQPVMQLAPCIEELYEPWALAIVAVLLVFLSLLIYRDTGSLFAVVAVVGILVAILGPFYVILGLCGEPPELVITPPAQETGEGDPTIVDLGGGDGDEDETGTSVPIPTVLFGLVIVLAVLASAVLFFAAGSTGESATPTSDEIPSESGEPSIEAVARSAGAAADRLEADAELDNEIYRAWAEMTAHLEVRSPESSTPAEFADAAVDAGMAREDVEELTRLFEDVRYGGVEPTADRERRAIGALRRIERTYAETDGER